MTDDEFIKATLAMTEEEWYSHDLMPPCTKGTKRCIAAHKLQDDCILLGPPRLP